MKNTTRILSLLLAALTLAVSCGQSGSSGETSAAETTTSSVETEPSEYVKPDVSYAGEKLRVFQSISAAPRWTASTYSDIRCEEENGDPINDAQYRRNRKVEEALGLEIEIIENHLGDGNRNTKDSIVKNVMANDDFADLVFPWGDDYKTLLAEENYVIDLRDISTLNFDASWWDQSAIEAFTFGGTTKALTGDISIFTSFSPIMLFFNKNVADQFGMNDMYDLVREGKWTYDKMKENCIKVAGDINGDTVMDESDRYGMLEQSGMVADMLISGGVRFTERDSNGVLQAVLNSERTATQVEEYVTFLNDASINNCSQHFDDKYGNVFYELHVPMFANDQALFNYQQLLIAFELRSMQTDYGILPFPKWDEEQEDYYVSISNSWVTLVSVPGTTPLDRYDMIGHALDALGYYSQQYVTPAFVDTTVRTKSLRDEDSAEMLEIILDNVVYDIAQLYNWGNLYNVVKNAGWNNNPNFASQWAAIEKNVKAKMAESLAQLES